MLSLRNLDLISILLVAAKVLWHGGNDQHDLGVGAGHRDTDLAIDTGAHGHVQEPVVSLPHYHNSSNKEGGGSLTTLGISLQLKTKDRDL